MIQYGNEKIIELNDGIQAWVDEDTDLMWEVKNKSNIGYWYIWHSRWLSNVNEYIESDMENEIRDCTSYVARLNTSNYAGFSDWRLPTISELQSIVDENDVEYHIKKTLSKNSMPAYWSASPTFAVNVYRVTTDWRDSAAIDGIYVIQFKNTMSEERKIGYLPSNALWVRCVRSQ